MMGDTTDTRPPKVTLQSKVPSAHSSNGSNTTSGCEPLPRKPQLDLTAMSTSISVDTHHVKPCNGTTDGVDYPYATLIPTLVSALLVIAGWAVLNKAQANRERRKQIREHVTGLRNDLDTLEKMTIDYHTATREMAAEQRVISRLGRFEKACGLLPRLLSSQTFFRAMDAKVLSIDPEHLKELSQAMTLKHFADEHTNALTVQDELVQRIEMASEKVHEDLEFVRISALD